MYQLGLTEKSLFLDITLSKSFRETSNTQTAVLLLTKQLLGHITSGPGRLLCRWPWNEEKQGREWKWYVRNIYFNWYPLRLNNKKWDLLTSFESRYIGKAQGNKSSLVPCSHIQWYVTNRRSYQTTSHSLLPFFPLPATHPKQVATGADLN